MDPEVGYATLAVVILAMIMTSFIIDWIIRNRLDDHEKRIKALEGK